MTKAEDEEALAIIGEMRGEDAEVIAMIREMRRDFREFKEEFMADTAAIMYDLRGFNDTIGAIDAHLNGCRLTTERTLRVLRGGRR
jgi:hypothetical protein